MDPSFARTVLPHGIVRWIDWAERFRRVGLDRSASLRAAAQGAWRQALVASRIEHLPDWRGPGVVVDVGAHEGRWAAALARFRRIARLVSLEPNPGLQDALRRRLAGTSGIDRFDVDPRAVGRSAGRSVLFRTASSDLASIRPLDPSMTALYGERAASVVDSVEVPVTTLDEAVPAELTIDLLKIDVQGSEREVLAGGLATLGRSRSVLLELNFVPHYRGEAGLIELAQELGSHGFDLYDLGPIHRSADGRALWADAVFLRTRAR